MESIEQMTGMLQAETETETKTVEQNEEGQLVEQEDIVFQREFFNELLEKFFKFLDKNDLASVLQASKLFKAIVEESGEIQDYLRSKALESTRLNLNDLQKAYLSSPRVENQIRRRAFTVKEAIANMKSFETLNINVTPNYGINYSSIYFNNPLATAITLIPEAIKLGCLPKEVRYAWFSTQHIEALKKGVPFEEIEGLTAHQVNVILTTGDTVTKTAGDGQEFTQFVQKVSRKEIEGIPFTEGHIKALQQKMSLKLIKDLSEIQVHGLLNGFSEEDVRAQWFSVAHIAMRESEIKDFYSMDEIKGLTQGELELLMSGISHKSILDLRNDKKKSGSYNDANSTIIMLLAKGYKLEDIQVLNAQQLSMMSYQGKTLAEVVSMGNSNVHTTNTLIQQGYKISQIEGLSKVAKDLMAFGIGGASCGEKLSLEQVQELKPYQLRVLGSLDVEITFEQAKKIKTHLHAMALEYGMPYEAVVKYDVEQILFLMSQEDYEDYSKDQIVASNVTTPKPLTFSNLGKVAGEENSEKSTPLANAEVKFNTVEKIAKCWPQDNKGNKIGLYR